MEALTTEWRERPPVHMLAASYLGYKPAAAPTSKSGEQVVRLVDLQQPPP